MKHNFDKKFALKSIPKLLDAEVEWVPLGEVAEMKRGTSMNKKAVQVGNVPVIAGGQKPAYYHNESNREGETIVIAGSGAYAGFVSWWDKPIFVSDAFSIKPKCEVLNLKYCFYFLKSKQHALFSKQSKGGVPHFYMRDLKPFKLPLPCPDEQQRIADCLSSLDEWIDVEKKRIDALKDHKKGLMEQLFPADSETHPKLSFLEFEDGAEVEWVPLGSVTEYEQPYKYQVRTTNYSPSYKTPVLTAGKSFILGYTDEVTGIYKAHKNPVILFDDFTTAIQWADFDFKVKSSAMKLVKARDESKVLLRYIYYWLLHTPYTTKDHTRHWISIFSKKTIPLPCPDEQQRIADCLSSLDEWIDAQTERVTTLKEHKKGLLQQLFPSREKIAS